MRKMRRALVIATVLALVVPAGGRLIIQHEGTTYPPHEGWNMRYDGSNFTVPPGGIDDGGVPAYAIQDDADVSSNGSRHTWEGYLTDDEIGEMRATGWRATAKLRLTTAPDSADDTCVHLMVGLHNGTWWLRFGTDEQDNIIVKIASSFDPPPNDARLVGTFAGGALAYHTWALEDPDHDMLADLYADGNLVAADIEPRILGHRRVSWGSRSALDTGSANWALVRLESMTGMGDANADGVVDDNDLSLLLANWTGVGGEGKTWGQGDFDGNGAVSDTDLSLLLANWTGSPDSIEIPEPAALSVLAVGGLALRRRRRRRHAVHANQCAR